MIAISNQDIKAEPHSFSLKGPADLRIVGLQANPRTGNLVMTALGNPEAVLVDHNFLLAMPGIQIPDNSEYQAAFGPFVLFKQPAKTLIV
jgi:hypothetical protein